MSGRRRAPRRLLAAGLLAAVSAGHGGVSGCTTDGGGASDPRSEATPVMADGARDAATDAAPDETTGSTAGRPATGDASAKPDAREPQESPMNTVLVTLDADTSRSPITAPLEIDVVARNVTGENVRLLVWNTPFEAVLSADLFSVVRDGEVRPYRGRKLKRAVPPGEGDFVQLAPGETLERVVDLSRYYALDAPGTYEIRFTPRAVAVDGAEDGLATLVAADGAGVVVERH